MESKVIEIQGIKIVKLSHEADLLPSNEGVTLFVTSLKAAIKKGDLRGTELQDKVEIKGSKRREMLIEYTDMYPLWRDKALKSIEEQLQKRKPSLKELQAGQDVSIKDLFAKYQSNLTAAKK